MKRFFAAIKRIAFAIPFNFWSMAGISLVLIGLSFALYLPKLGFYLDDWPQLYSMVVRGTEGIKTYFLYDDRPFGWWPDLLIFKIWGTNPLGWHISNYLLRWMVGLGIWGTFTQIWASNKREVFWVVQLFAVFPLFNQQSMGLTFIAHWFCYALFFLSLYLMVMAVRKPKYRLLLFTLAIVTNVANLFTYENFIGVEFMRPVILWLALREIPHRQRIKKSLLYWLPFLVLAIFYIVWRVFLMENVRGLDPILFNNLFTNPGSTLIQLANYILRDVLYMLVTVWFPTLDVSGIDLTVPYLLVSLFLVLAVAGGFIFVLIKTKRNSSTEINSYEKDQFAIEAFVIGILGVIMGMAPGWLINRTLTGSGLWNDRFGLSAMWAVPLFMVGFLSLLIHRERFKQEMIIVILLGLAVGRNFAVTNEYKWSTTWQQRFAAQLLWRAPALKANTSFLSDNELFTKMGVYPTSFMLNLIYPSQQPMPALDHWFFTIEKYFPTKTADLPNGIELQGEHWYAKYNADSRNSLVIAWNRSGADCLWVLSENDRYNPLISTSIQKVLAVSNLSRIQSESPQQWPDTNLFGNEDLNTWCYYYESADLARQQGDWENVTSLYEQAKSAGYSPANGVELIPFIEAYARTGQADIASDLTVVAKSLTPLMRDYICDTWNRIAKDVHNDPLFVSEYEAYAEQDLCWEVK